MKYLKKLVYQNTQLDVFYLLTVNWLFMWICIILFLKTNLCIISPILLKFIFIDSEIGTMLSFINKMQRMLLICWGWRWTLGSPAGCLPSTKNHLHVTWTYPLRWREPNGTARQQLNSHSFWLWPYRLAQNFHAMTHWSLTITQARKEYCYPHCADEESKTVRH